MSRRTVDILASGQAWGSAAGDANLVGMRCRNENDRTRLGDLPRTARSHLAKEEVYQDGQRPED